VTDTPLDLAAIEDIDPYRDPSAATQAIGTLVADLRALLTSWAEKDLDPWDWAEPADELTAVLARITADTTGDRS